MASIHLQRSNLHSQKCKCKLFFEWQIIIYYLNYLFPRTLSYLGNFICSPGGKKTKCQYPEMWIVPEKLSIQWIAITQHLSLRKWTDQSGQFYRRTAEQTLPWPWLLVDHSTSKWIYGTLGINWTKLHCTLTNPWGHHLPNFTLNPWDMIYVNLTHVSISQISTPFKVTFFPAM